MKQRVRKKAFDCSHHVYEDFFLTDDPYPIYNTEDYCKLGKFDNTWLAPNDKVTDMCERCRKFCVSRPMVRKQRVRSQELKEWNKSYKKYCRVAMLDGNYEKEASTGILELAVMPF